MSPGTIQPVSPPTPAGCPVHAGPADHPSASHAPSAAPPGTFWLAIVIPTFNYGRFIGRAIESVLDQRPGEVEIVVVDDGSTDLTASVVARYAPAVRYERQPHAGPYAACKRGLSVTTAPHVLFLDADDRLADGALAHIRAEIGNHPDLWLLVGSVINVRPDGTRRLSPGPSLVEPQENFAAYVRGRLNISAGGSVVRRDVFTPYQPLTAPMPHGMDRVIIARALAMGPSRSVEHPLVEIYHHAGRLRDNIASISSSGTLAAQWLFGVDGLPIWAEKYRGAFAARLYREHLTVFSRAGRHRQAAAAYLGALRHDARTLLDLRSGRRFLWCGARSLFAGHTESPAAAGAGSLPSDHSRAFRDDPIGFVLDASRTGEDVALLRMGRPTYLLSDVRDIKHVLAGAALNYHKTGWETAFRQYFGRGLARMEGEAHRARRKALSPHFRPLMVAQRVPEIAAWTIQFTQRWEEQQTVNLAAQLMAWASVLQARFTFGAVDESWAARLLGWIHNSHHGLARNRAGRRVGPEILHLRSLWRHRRALRQVQRMAQERIESLGTDPLDQRSFLGLALKARAAGELSMSDRDLRATAIDMFIPLDPIANNTAWACRLLAGHPEVEARLLEELGRVLGGRPPDPSDLPALRYTQMVVDESLRLYPTVWLLTRRAVEPDDLPGGTQLPAGCDVWISPLALHRDPRHYPRPESFEPERFATEAPENRAYSYLPFGSGPRICIGNHLTRITLVTALACLLPRFRFAPADDAGDQLETANAFTLQPPQGRLMMHITRR